MSSPPAAGLPRLLTIMGSGETSPTMVKTHRQLLARLGPDPIPAVLLDTPFGFQGNAGDISARAQAYFRQSVGVEVAVASFRSAAEADSLAEARFAAQVRDSRYVFAGPGSPSYALRQWVGSDLPALLSDKLALGGAVTFASAAALTLGVATVPVYEIYKVGAVPHWLDGLDLLAQAGLRAAVIPHYNNAEGGNHDTRFCYLGERRLATMEAALAEGAFVLGVDEHTGLILDLGAGSATVVGRGVVTIRAHGRSETLASGSVVPLATLAELAERAGAPATGTTKGAEAGVPAGGRAESPAVPPSGASTSPLLDAVADHEARFSRALAGRDPDGATLAILELEDDLAAWARDTLESDEADRGRAALRSMVVALGELARAGAQDPRDVLGPFVEVLLDLRRQAREDRRYQEADRLRERLLGLGIEVRDTAERAEWLITGPAGDGPAGDGAAPPLC